MFKRPEDTYKVSRDALDRICHDSASPLNHIAEMIPAGSAVLDIGAGNGLLGQMFMMLNKTICIDAIEPNKYAAEIAKPFYRATYVGFSSEFLELIKKGNYDYIVLADVVEHTIDPKEFLDEICSCLNSSTTLIVSLPNIAFGGQRLSLLNGYFNYVDSGLLEKTHLRFFTIETAKKLFNSTLLSISTVIYLNRSFYRTEFSRKFLKASFLQLVKLINKPDARAYQYIFVLRKEPVHLYRILSSGDSRIKTLFDIFFYRPLFINIAKYLLSKSKKLIRDFCK
jgi:2-polyprenyl-3-methyl-5-hydroxy-6-metoxy-1,4-benzoquinol methylase